MSKYELAEEYIRALQFEVGALKNALANIHGKSKELAARLREKKRPSESNESIEVVAVLLADLPYTQAGLIQKAWVARVDARTAYMHRVQEEQLFEVALPK